MTEDKIKNSENDLKRRNKMKKIISGLEYHARQEHAAIAGLYTALRAESGETAMKIQLEVARGLLAEIYFEDFMLRISQLTEEEKQTLIKSEYQKTAEVLRKVADLICNEPRQRKLYSDE